jgi:hypothetical protein
MSRMLGGTQGQSGVAQKISPPLGIYHQTVQPIQGQRANYTIPAHWEVHYFIYIYNILK